MKSSKMLGLMIALQCLILIGQWMGQPSVRPAKADVQLPNPSERQLAILDELKTLNGKVDHLIDLFQGGDAKVEVTKVDRAK